MIVLLFNVIRLSKTILTVMTVCQSCWWYWQDSVYNGRTSWIFCVKMSVMNVANRGELKVDIPFLFCCYFIFLSIHSFIESFTHPFFLLLFLWLLQVRRLWVEIPSPVCSTFSSETTGPWKYVTIMSLNEWITHY